MSSKRQLHYHDQPSLSSSGDSDSAQAILRKFSSQNDAIMREDDKRKESKSISKVPKKTKQAYDSPVDHVRIDGDQNSNDENLRRIVTVKLNCTELDCGTIVDNRIQLNEHLLAVHNLLPLQCFATGCNVRVKESREVATHINDKHKNMTEWPCSECDHVSSSHHNQYKHWYAFHQRGTFHCASVPDCSFVAERCAEVSNHQQRKHRSTKYGCTFEGCDKSYHNNFALKRHQISHQDVKPFWCVWKQCGKKFTNRSHATRHIRINHFGLPANVKDQKEKGINDSRDPNQYVRVFSDPTKKSI